MTLPYVQLIHEIRRDIEEAHLIALQTRIIGVTDHDLRLTLGAARLDENPKPHLAQRGNRLVRVFRGRSRASTRSLHKGLGKIKLAVAQLRNHMYVRVGIDSHARRNHRNTSTITECECRGDRYGIVVDHQGERFETARVTWR